MLIDLERTDINAAVRAEGMDVCVISYGGSCSNRLADTLESSGFKCRTPLWDRMLCHCGSRLDLEIPVVYIFDDPLKSFLSMKRRDGLLRTNFRKLSNGDRSAYSDERMLQLMHKQFKAWTQAADEPGSRVLAIGSHELFEEHIRGKLASFLGVGESRLRGFPVQYKPPQTALACVSRDVHRVFDALSNEVADIRARKMAISSNCR